MARSCPSCTYDKTAPIAVRLASMYRMKGSGISPEAKAKFSELINEFSDVFSKNQWDISQCDLTTHKIQVEPGSRPIKLTNRRMPLHYKDDLQKKSMLF